MNVQEYIDSGVLYDYATGSLTSDEMAVVEDCCAAYPEINAELLRLQQSLEFYAQTIAMAPAVELQESIWSKLENINKEKAGDINLLPVINKYSDHHNWKRIVMPFMPADLAVERSIRVIRSSGGVTQMLVISKTDVEEEVHEHERESFLILEGSCECYIGDSTYRLGPGGFIDVPLHISHNVKVLSPYVVAVLQHVAI